MVGEDKGDEVRPEVGSQEHERWRCEGGEERRWLELVALAEEGERELEGEGKGVGVLLAFYSGSQSGSGGVACNIPEV
jgi:hypothetical protein